MNTRTGMDADSFRDDIEQHLKYTLAKDHYAATEWDLYQSVALSVMDPSFTAILRGKGSASFCSLMVF